MVRVWISFLVVLLVAASAQAQRFTAVHTAVAINSGATPVVAANGQRNFLLLINDSDTNIFCKLGATAVVHEGILLVANGGGLLLDSKFSSQAINCITLSGNGKILLVTQGQQ